MNCAGVGPDGRSVRFPALAELSGDFAPGRRLAGASALWASPCGPATGGARHDLAANGCRPSSAYARRRDRA